MRSHFEAGFPVLCTCIIAVVFIAGCGGGRKPFILEKSVLIPADSSHAYTIAFHTNPPPYLQNKEVVIETVNVFFWNKGLSSPNDTVLICKLNGDINGGTDEDIDLPPFSPTFTTNLQAPGDQVSSYAAIYPIRMHICPGCLVSFGCFKNKPEEMRVSITFLGYLIALDNTTP